MAFTYKRVPTVKAGEPISSAQYNALAESINDRLKNGIGDPSWRLFWYADSLFQFIRLGSGSHQPARDEWWSHWSHMNPNNAKDWPQTPVGTNGGINASNPIAAFVFGNEGLQVYNETDRMNYDVNENTGVKLHGISAPVSDLDHWEIAKVQRGVTPASRDDLTYANALASADQYYKINYSKMFSYLKGYGGFQAGPDVVGLCNDPANAEYLVKFRNISSGDNCVYNTCKDKSGSGTSNCPNYSKPIDGWFAGVYGYVLYHHDDTTTVLPYNDYVEGPYTTNAFLNHERGGQLDFAVDAYASEFRGADNGSVSQRKEPAWNPQTDAFRFENFFTQQYYLAPAYGSGPYGLTSEYPQFDFPPETGSGVNGVVNGGTSHTIRTGFCFAGMIATTNVGTVITNPKTFGIYVNGNLVYTLKMDAGTEPSRSYYFPAVFPEGSVIQVKCNESYGASEDAYVEIAEIMAMTPRIQDAYTVLRMASSRNQTMDGWGHEEADAKGIWDSYQRHGMAANYLRSGIKEQQQTGIWKNPVYEEVRRIVHDRLRLAKRDLLQGYEVNSEGNSVFYFRRFQPLLAGSVDTGIDVFEGIAPSPTAITSGFVKAGVKYKVTGSGASIDYNGTPFSEDDIFTGLYPHNNWTVITGTPAVFEHEIIIDEAPKQGETNQWQVFLQTLPYKDSGSNIYKPNVFADRDGMFVDRCTLLSNSWGQVSDQGQEIRNHVYARQTKPINRQENPSGYRYVLGTNQPSYSSFSGDLPAGVSLPARDNTADCQDHPDPTECKGTVSHYKSCQIYVPDYELKSVTYDHATSLVAVELKGRLRRNDNVTSQAILNTQSSRTAYMNVDDNTAGTPAGPAAARSDENAIVEYLRYKAGGEQCVIRIGDQSGDASTLSDWQSNIYNGACFPRFHFTKQMPKVYADGNVNLDQHDTRMTIDNMLWSGFIVRAICEGYVDQNSDASVTPTVEPPCNDVYCGQNRMYDYKYSSLMLQAMGNRWFTMHPEVADGYNWEGFGPFAQMECYADHFNQVAKSLNLLTRARLDLPVLGVRHRTQNYTAKTYTAGSPDTACSYTFDATIPDNLPWVKGTASSWYYSVPSTSCHPHDLTLQSTKVASLDPVGGCGVKVDRIDTEYEIAFGNNTVENMAKFALSDELQQMITVSNGYGYMVADQQQFLKGIAAVTGTLQPCGVTIDGGTPAEKHYEFEQEEDLSVVCRTVTSGVLEAPNPKSDTALTRLLGDTECSINSKSTRTITFSNVRAVINVPLV
jgi:hypothetical protein